MKRIILLCILSSLSLIVYAKQVFLSCEIRAFDHYRDSQGNLVKDNDFKKRTVTLEMDTTKKTRG